MGLAARVRERKGMEEDRFTWRIIFGTMTELRNCPWLGAACSNLFIYSSHFTSKLGRRDICRLVQKKIGL